jgi:hypothetical protein
MDSSMYTYNSLNSCFNEGKFMNTAGKILLSAQGTYYTGQSGSPFSSPLIFYGSLDDKAGKAGPRYLRPRVSKLFKEGHQARVH